jgi:hypothetical protein
VVSGKSSRRGNYKFRSMLNTHSIAHQQRLPKAAALAPVRTLSGWIVSDDLTNLMLGAIVTAGIAFMLFPLPRLLAQQKMQVAPAYASAGT